MKKQIIAILGTLLVCLLVSGCITGGNPSLKHETQASVATKILEGKTTKPEVRALFGEPSAVTFTDDGLEIFQYDYHELKPHAVNFIPLLGIIGSKKSGIKKQLSILFDDQGIAKKISVIESPIEKNRGIFTL